MLQNQINKTQNKLIFRDKLDACYLDDIAKEFNSNRLLGQIFFKSIMAVKFPTNTSKFSFLRNAILVCNLICP